MTNSSRPRCEGPPRRRRDVHHIARHDGQTRFHAPRTAVHTHGVLGAIRLPNDAFKKNAGTEVTSDIIMLRKLRAGGIPTGTTWKETAVFTNDIGEAFTLNEYFAARPEMMRGQMRLTGGMYGGNEPALETDGRKLEEALAQAIEKLPQGIHETWSHKIAEPTLEEAISAPRFRKVERLLPPRRHGLYS